MHYLFSGDDTPLKEQKISDIKKRLLPSADAVRFDCDTLYAHKLTPEELKKSLLALPGMGSTRLVIVREAEKLKAENKAILQEFFESGEERTAVVLEFASRDKFIREIQAFVEVQECALNEQQVNVFDVTRLMSARRHADAMAMLHDILSSGAHPLQIIGGLTWFWGKRARSRLPEQRFEKGLLCLQEADLNIKRSKLPPEYALEMLIAKLGVLLNG